MAKFASKDNTNTDIIVIASNLGFDNDIIFLIIHIFFMMIINFIKS